VGGFWLAKEQHPQVGLFWRVMKKPNTVFNRMGVDDGIAIFVVN
jgi:hypothetical protein